MDVETKVRNLLAGFVLDCVLAFFYDFFMEKTRFLFFLPQFNTATRSEAHILERMQMLGTTNTTVPSSQPLTRST